MAMAMPVMPNMLPRIEVVGCDRPFKAWMKHTEAARYSSTTRFIVIGPPRLSFHVLRCPPRGPSRLRAAVRRSLLGLHQLGVHFLFLLLEHLQHPARHQEAAEDVHRGQGHGQ